MKSLYLDQSVGQSFQTIKDIKGNKSENIYNVAGQLLQTIDRGNDRTKITTSYEYNSKGQIIRQNNGNGSYITYTYNDEDQCTGEKSYNPDGTIRNETVYTYDTYGNRSCIDSYVADETGMRLVGRNIYVYNEYGELVTEGQINRNIFLDGMNDTSSQYDYVSSAEAEYSSFHYTYDVDGRLIGKEYPIISTDSSGILSESYEYNAKGMLTAVKADVVENGNRRTVTLSAYTYSSRGMLIKSTTLMSPLDTDSDTLVKTYSYDKFGRVTRIEYSRNSDKEVFESYAYTYDKNSNIVSETSTGKRKEVKKYTYNAKGQLVGTYIAYNDSYGSRYTYGYDETGNCTSVIHDNTSSVMTYNGLNQLTNKADYSYGNNSQNTSYTYDGSGNLVTSVATTVSSGTAVTENLAYDPYNRMISETRKAGNQASELIQKNFYNGDDVRIASISLDKNSGVTSYNTENYYYGRGSLSYIRNAEGRTTSRYVTNPYGAVVIREEKINESEYNSKKRYINYTKDIRGSVKSLLSQNGTRLVNYNYDDYGNTSVSVESGNTARAGYNNHLCYTGGVYDKVTGRYYLNARYYTPSTMNFLSQDSYRELDNPVNWNLYGYCAGNPVGYTDPSGHYAETIFDIISIGTSAYDMVTNPSLSNALFLVWDIAAAVAPVLPASYTLKAADKAADVVKVVDTTSDVTKGAKKVGKASKKAGKKIKGKATGKIIKTSYGKSIEISEQKMYQVGEHFNKHGREMGYLGKKEYEQAARSFFEQNKSSCEIYEGIFNNSRGNQSGQVQYILRQDGKQLIINKESGQIIDFYNGTSLDAFIKLERLQ